MKNVRDYDELQDQIRIFENKYCVAPEIAK